MKRIMLACHHCVSHRLEQRLGYFELLGFDFMLDSENHVSHQPYLLKHEPRGA